MSFTDQQIKDYATQLQQKGASLAEIDQFVSGASQNRPGVFSKNAPGLVQAGQEIKGAFNSGVSQTKQGLGMINQSEGGFKGLVHALGGVAKAGAGVVNTAFSPLAPVFNPISKDIINPLGDKLSGPAADINGNVNSGYGRTVQRFANSGTGKAVTAGADFTTDVGTLAQGALAVEGGVKTGEKVATQTGEALSNLKENIGTKVQDHYVNQNIKDWTAPANKPGFKKATNILESAQKNKVNPSNIAETLTNNKLNPADHIQEGRYVTKEAADQLHQDASKLSTDVLRPSLQKADLSTPRTPVTEVLTKAISNIEKNKLLTSETKEVLTDRLNHAQGVLQKQFPDGMSLTEMHDERIIRDLNSKYNELSDTGKTLEAQKNKALADSLRTTVEQKAPKDIPVKQFQAELQKQYKASDYLEALDGKKAPVSAGAKFRKYVGKLTGVGIASHLGGGILADVGGYHIGGMVESFLENLPNPLREKALENLKVSNPAVFDQVKGYLNAPQPNFPQLPAPKTIFAGPRTQAEPKIEILPAEKQVYRSPDTGQMQRGYKSTPQGEPQTLKGNKGFQGPGAKNPVEFSPEFKGFKDLTTKVLTKLEGRKTISKQFISDLTNGPELKQAERNLIRDVLKDMPDNVPVKEFANRVKSELLPLKRSQIINAKYENIALDNNLRGDINNYKEHIYNSPIKTSAGDVHFPSYAETSRRAGTDSSSNYFAHTRVEDLTNPKVKTFYEDQANNKGSYRIDKGDLYDKATGKNLSAGDTRRVIELQSDLFQKGGLEREGGLNYKDVAEYNKDYPDQNFGKADRQRIQEMQKLEPYRNTWHERVIREEIKQAAKDGKTKLQFPTGKTAMEIEGLGRAEDRWTIPIDEAHPRGQDLSPENLQVGLNVRAGHGPFVQQWIITDVLGDGKFKAVDPSTLSGIAHPGRPIPIKTSDGTRYFNPSLAETFDISGKVDTDNPIYKFYEKEVGKYLINKFGATKIKDPQGVDWWEVKVDPKLKSKPIDVFSLKQREKTFA